MKQILVLLLLLLVAATSFGQVKISSYEYWFDNNYTNKVTTTITQAAAFTFDSAINTNNLSAGLHSFSIRFRDNTTNYSIVKSAYFYKAASKITGYEYWIDGNYTKKIAKSSTATTVSIPIDATQLTTGFHTLNIRFKDDVGVWGVVKSSYFVRSSRTIVSYEYWFDNNYARRIQQTTSSQTVTFSTPISDSLLSDGLHQFNVRFQGENRTWSSVSSAYIYKGAYTIAAYEYWIDDYTNKVLQILSSASPFYTLDIGIDVASLSAGSHLINFRFKDKAGVWSATVAKYFNTTPKDQDKDGLPNAIETVRYGTDTANFDTNGDWLADGVNVFTGLKPLSSDTDGDGISNSQEIINGTNAILRDSDFDGVPDKLDPFPLDRFRTKLPPSSATDHTPPVITLLDPL